MRWHRVGVSSLIFMGFVLLGLSGVLQSGGEERLMMIWTTPLLRTLPCM